MAENSTTGLGLAEVVIRAVVDSLRQAWKSRSAALAALFLAAFAVVIASCEYVVNRWSLQLIWPDDNASARIALSVVLAVAGAGLLLHFQNRAVRAVAACLGVILMAVTGTLAYYRTLELDRIRLVNGTLSAPQTEQGVIAFGGGIQVAAAPEAAPQAPQPDHLPAILASLLALLLIFAGVLFSFGAFSSGHEAFLALISLPFLIIALAIRGAPHFYKACREAWAALVTLIKRLLPPTWTAEADQWRTDRMVRWAESSRRRRYHQFVLQEQDRDARSVGDALEHSRRDITTAHLDGVRELLEALANQRRVFFGEAIQQAFRNLRAQAANSSLRVVSMLFWPLERVWRVVGENLSPDSSVTEEKKEGKKKEGSVQ